MLLNSFLTEKLQASAAGTVNDADLIVANQLKEFLETARQLPVLQKINGMPLLHWLAEQRLYRCMDIIIDNYIDAAQCDNVGRNYFVHLVLTRRYRIAKELIARWGIQGPSDYLAKLLLHFEAVIFKELATAVKQRNNHAIELTIQLLAAVPFDKIRGNSNFAVQEAYHYAMYSLYQAITSVENALKPASLILGEKLSVKRKAILSLLPELEKLKENGESLIDIVFKQDVDLFKLITYLSDASFALLEREDDHLKESRTLLMQCKKQLAASVGSKRYAAFEKKPAPNATLRLMR